MAANRGIRTTPTQHGRLLIEIGETGPTATFIAGHENSYVHYVRMFEEGRYSLLLCDGGLISIKYEIDGNNVVWHRYTYVPPIVKLDTFGGETIDFLPTAEEYFHTPRQTMLRFEYDPGAQADRHPYSHLHLNSADCRLPVSGALSVTDFLYCVVDLFYPQFLGELGDRLRPTQASVSHLHQSDAARMLLKIPL